MISSARLSVGRIALFSLPVVLFQAIELAWRTYLPQHLAATGVLMVAIPLASAVLHLGYSLIVTPHGGWGLELGRDAHERTRLMSAKIWYASAGAIGLLLIVALLERVLHVGKPELAAALGILIALLAPLCVVPVVHLPRAGGAGGAGHAAARRDPGDVRQSLAASAAGALPAAGRG